MDTGALIIGPPKSRTGLPTVAPHAFIPDQRRHLGNFTGAEEPDALIFTGKRADVLRRANFRARPCVASP